MEIVRPMLAQIHPAQRYLFPHASDPWKRMSENTLNFALKRLGYKDHLTRKRHPYDDLDGAQ